MSLSEKVFIITGASSGIGASTAKLLAKNGAKIMLAARRVEKLQDLQKEIGEQAAYHETDVTDYVQVQALVEATVQKFGKVDVLINNAGVGYLGPMEEAAIEEWHTMMDVNINGVLNAIHAALPELLQSKGHIFNIDSVAGHNYFPRAVVYCASKHAVKALSYGIRVEFRDKVKVTNISPGAVATEFITHFTHEETKKNMENSFQNGLQPDDIAQAILEVLAKPPHVVVNEVIIRPNI
ncbi:MAG: SDR family oxidoreductase [Bacteroidota bacterium]